MKRSAIGLALSGLILSGCTTCPQAQVWDCAFKSRDACCDSSPAGVNAGYAEGTSPPVVGMVQSQPIAMTSPQAVVVTPQAQPLPVINAPVAQPAIAQPVVTQPVSAENVFVPSPPALGPAPPGSEGPPDDIRNPLLRPFHRIFGKKK